MPNDIPTKHINKLITEELGISDKLYLKINEVIKSIKKGLRNNEKHFDVIWKQNGNIHLDIIDDNKHIVNIFWAAYYFDTIENYYEYIKTHFFPNGYDYNSQILMISIIFINNKIYNNSLYDTVAHELEHAFQECLMNKPFGNEKLYMFAISNLHNKNEAKQILSSIIYASTKSEQEAMINGCYNEIINNGELLNDIDSALKKSDCTMFLMKLYQAYYFLKSNKENVELINAINEYNDKFHINYNKFLSITRNGIVNLERRIARLTIKLKSMFLNEHLMEQKQCNNILNYFIIQ